MNAAVDRLWTLDPAALHDCRMPPRVDDRSGCCVRGVVGCTVPHGQGVTAEGHQGGSVAIYLHR